MDVASRLLLDEETWLELLWLDVAETVKVMMLDEMVDDLSVEAEETLVGTDVELSPVEETVLPTELT